MSNVKDLWGDFIHITAEPEIVSITCVERVPDGRGYVRDRSTMMDLDAAQTRKLIKKLKKALDEMEDM